MHDFTFCYQVNVELNNVFIYNFRKLAKLGVLSPLFHLNIIFVIYKK